MTLAADVSEVVTLSLDLDRLAATAVPRVRPIIKRGALNIKTQMSAELRGSDAFKGAARQVSFDLNASPDGLEALIGPDKDRARKGHGSIANIAYFGGSRGGGGTVPDPVGALLAEAPSLLRYLGELIEEV